MSISHSVLPQGLLPVDYVQNSSLSVEGMGAFSLPLGSEPQCAFTVLHTVSSRGYSQHSLPANAIPMGRQAQGDPQSYCALSAGS